ncbi:hypothetical protein A2773_01435 [Candidatus Gottesmanbacteria bacterium RIFCSPHIGHO2_01_FULL_39_10]|uniref:Uncharacterized protein n=1 Tax=Candidatus Gottesmanbacteria bacterium RIFCSPHIGHO2_01_FULL_39_10 TaxID=1798375 RepID=A0A1F5ZNC2_9BACT|nr:MAG: hypothetical protein A2773_01435 [Candidatus Gottesmanbacteria bacterium RIFCSPHIGHO2_01_FULL_39_10]
MEYPDEEKTVDVKKAPPGPNFVVRLPMDAQSTANISTKPQANLKIIFVLILIFTFVSIMVGFLMWIFQYEMKKRGLDERYRNETSSAYPVPIDKV